MNRECRNCAFANLVNHGGMGPRARNNVDCQSSGHPEPTTGACNRWRAYTEKAPPGDPNLKYPRDMLDQIKRDFGDQLGLLSARTEALEAFEKRHTMVVTEWMPAGPVIDTVSDLAVRMGKLEKWRRKISGAAGRSHAPRDWKRR